MSDVEYRNSAAFRALNGQTAPAQELLDGVFKNARFDTRFYEEVQCFENPSASASAVGEGAFFDIRGAAAADGCAGCGRF